MVDDVRLQSSFRLLLPLVAFCSHVFFPPRRGVSPSCGSMIVPWGAVGPTTAVGVYKPPHAPERGVRRPPRDMPLCQ
eukprot:scaffold5520_cov102-Isochrysis_galbana.AAC.5